MGDVNILPDSAFAPNIVAQDEIYIYAQTKDTLVETRGSLKTSDSVYTQSKWSNIEPTSRFLDDKFNKNSPKLYSPLAATYFDYDGTKVKYLFYVDNDNIIHDVKQEKGKDWEHGSLSTLGVKCAHYSRLTAATPIDTYPYPIVSVYYQVPPGEEEDPETTIESVYLYYGAWKKGPVYLDDPPLSGCSISAVPAEQGIWFDQEKENDKLHQPVVFFQNEDLTLMTGQLKEQSSIKVKVKLPPHASISAVDNGTDCYCFYVADDNKINYIKIDSAGKVTNLGGLMTTTPRSDLTAVFYNQGSVEQIVLFYQVHHDTVARTYASTLTKSTTASVETWTTSVARHVF